MKIVSSIPEPGQLVEVRRRRYVVVDLAQSPLPPDAQLAGSPGAGRQHLVTLSSVEDDALGEELQMVWEIEPGAQTIEKTPLPRPVGFDAPAIRARKEQDDIRAILSELKENILRELHQPEVVQLEFTGFSSEERQQYERDLSSLAGRASQIDGEIE